jgi:hypothetical protein
MTGKRVTKHILSKTLQGCGTKKSLEGPTIAQTISRRLPTAAARIRAQVTSRGICGERNDTGVGFVGSTSVSPANSHYTDCSTFIIYHSGLVQWAN